MPRQTNHKNFTGWKGKPAKSQKKPSAPGRTPKLEKRTLGVLMIKESETKKCATKNGVLFDFLPQYFIQVFHKMHGKMLHRG